MCVVFEIQESSFETSRCFSLSQDFNDATLIDLKEINGFKILHLKDHSIRHGAATIAKLKQKEEIVKAIFKIRIILFGPPNEILRDNGGEFNNDLLRDLLNQLNVFIRTTPGESPWSNGITENAILWNMINKLLIDKSNNNSADIIVAMGCYGFSPNQLVFNKSSNFLSVLIDKSPALEGKTSSEIIVNH